MVLDMLSRIAAVDLLAHIDVMSHEDLQDLHES